MRKISLVLVLLFSCIYNTQASEIKNYFKIGAGFSRGEVDVKSYIENDKESFSENAFPNITFGIGQIYNNMFDYGVNFTYQEHEIEDYTLKNYLTSFNLNYLIQTNLPITPYIGVGLNINNFKFSVEGIKDNNTELSFAYRIGLRKAINETFDIDFNIQQTTKADAFSFYGDLKGEFKDTSFNLSLLYKF